MAKHPKHICRFNDGKSSCDCYDSGFEAGQKQMLKRFIEEFNKYDWCATWDDIKWAMIKSK